MNKLSSFMLCCSAVMMFSACTKDDQEDNTVLIKASIEIENNSESKVSVDSQDRTKLLWSAGDNIYLLCNNENKPRTAWLVEGAGTKTGTFKANIKIDNPGADAIKAAYSFSKDLFYSQSGNDYDVRNQIYSAEKIPYFFEHVQEGSGTIQYDNLKMTLDNSAYIALTLKQPAVKGKIESVQVNSIIVETSVGDFKLNCNDGDKVNGVALTEDGVRFFIFMRALPGSKLDGLTTISKITVYAEPNTRGVVPMTMTMTINKTIKDLYKTTPSYKIDGVVLASTKTFVPDRMD